MYYCGIVVYLEILCDNCIPQISVYSVSDGAKKASPHSVEQRAVVLQPQQLVGCGHVVGNGFLAIQEESVGCPDVTGQHVIQRQLLHWAFKAQALVLPALSEKHIDCVLLWRRADVSTGAFRVHPEGKAKLRDTELSC